MLVVPLSFPRGTPQGALVLASPLPNTMDAGFRSLLGQVAAQLGQVGPRPRWVEGMAVMACGGGEGWRP